MSYRILSKLALTLVVAGSAGLAACNSGGTASPGPNYAVGDITNSTPTAGQYKICKVGNVDGTFALTVTPVSGGTPVSSTPVTVAQGTCKVVVTDADPAGGAGGNVLVHETSAGFVSATAAGLNGSVPYTDNSTVLFINSIHGWTVTYTNNVVVNLGCTLTQGFWKNHPDAWPVSSLTLGTKTYTQAQLLSILGTPVKGNGLIDLAHQLIAAKLNIAAGASSAGIASTIAAADALIDSLLIPPVGSGSLDPSAVSSLVAALDAFNSGLSGVPSCETSS